MRQLEEQDFEESEEILEDASDGDDFYQSVEYLEEEEIYLTSENGPSKEQPSKILECPMCGKCFKKATTLRDHQNIHNNLKPHVCTICTRSFSFETSLVSHVKLHENVKNHKCSYCFKAFARRRNMLLHEKTVHLKEKPFVCPVCEKPYTDRSCWRKHIVTHEAPMQAKQVPLKIKPLRPKVVKAPKVIAREDNPSEKKTRQRRNTGPKRYKCDLCDKMFARRRNVLHHMTYTHNKIKPHECQFCGKKYSDITSFKRHIREHTDPELQTAVQLTDEAAVVSELLIGDLGELEFTPEGSDNTITLIVITDG